MILGLHKAGNCSPQMAQLGNYFTLCLENTLTIFGLIRQSRQKYLQTVCCKCSSGDDTMKDIYQGKTGEIIQKKCNDA